MYKISIIIPVFNVEKYLKRALDSILSQTFPIEEIQVIMVDDASTDNSGKIMEEYANKYSNFEAIHLEKNCGSPSIPRNIGLKYVKADYIMFLDPDDEYIKDMCETLYEEITKENADMVYCNNYITWEDNNDYDIIENDGEYRKIILNKNDIPPRFAIWAGIHKTDLIKNNKIQFHNVLAEDFVFTIEEFMNVKKAVYLKNYYGYVYYQYSDFSHASKPTVEKFYSTLKSNEIARDIVFDKEKEEWIPDLFGGQLLYLYERIPNLTVSWNEKIKLLKEIYNFEESIDFNIKIPDNLNLGGKLSYLPFRLLEKRLFNLALLNLELVNISKRTNFIRKAYNAIKGIIN